MIPSSENDGFYKYFFTACRPPGAFGEYRRTGKAM